jgi:hypothetical protein
MAALDAERYLSEREAEAAQKLWIVGNEKPRL